MGRREDDDGEDEGDVGPVGLLLLIFVKFVAVEAATDAAKHQNGVHDKEGGVFGESESDLQEEAT